ncbi:MAG: PEP-CTERM sorting domain-containing protein [Methylotenera sp.]|nr:PEP-CTERM sorting domain-containing protein [Methylotenera sp.]
MKSLKLKSWVMALGFALASVSAQAAVTKTADLDPAAGSELYQFDSVGAVASSFSDYLSLSFEGTRDLVAGINATSTKNISFSAFDLVASDMTTVLATGTFGNFGPRLALGGLTSLNGAGEYFIHIAGIASGAGTYNGTVSMVSPVPEPETYGMLLAGLGMIGFVARRRKMG